MPTILMHQTLGKRAVENLSPDVFFEISKQSQAFNFGCLGPDFFFCRGVLNPFYNYKKIINYGILQHSQRTNELFTLIFNYAKQHQNDDDFDVLYAYICGFLCHYGVDSTFHPLVYDIAPTNEVHDELEWCLDSWLAEQTDEIDATIVCKLNLTHIFCIGKTLPLCIAEFHRAILRYVYGEEVDVKVIQQSYQDMLSLFSLLHCENGFKRNIVKTMCRTIPSGLSSIFALYSENPYKLLDDHANQFSELKTSAVENNTKLISLLDDFLTNSSVELVDNTILPDVNFSGIA